MTVAEPRRLRRAIERADGEGFVVCECSGCAARHHRLEERHVPALWWLERSDVAEQVCGTCANLRTSSGERSRVLTPITDEEDDEDG